MHFENYCTIAVNLATVTGYWNAPNMGQGLARRESAEYITMNMSLNYFVLLLANLSIPQL